MRCRLRAGVLGREKVMVSRTTLSPHCVPLPHWSEWMCDYICEEAVYSTLSIEKPTEAGLREYPDYSNTFVWISAGRLPRIPYCSTLGSPGSEASSTP